MKRTIADQAAAETSGVHAAKNGRRVTFDKTCAIPCTIQCAIRAKNGTCETPLARNHLSCGCEIECLTSTLPTQAIRAKNGACETLLARNDLPCGCEMECATCTLCRQGTTRQGKHMERTNGVKRRTLLPLMYVFAYVCGMCAAWLNRKKLSKCGEGEYTENKRGTKMNTKANKKIRQRRLIQQRIRRWTKACKREYDGKDRMKYRHKVRASKRWQQRKGTTEAKTANNMERRKRTEEANNKKGRNRAKKMKKANLKRKGGAGGRGRAKKVEASNVEEELMKDIGVP
eukprot:1388011-Pleurochrysis_carterae.AAC.1